MNSTIEQPFMNPNEIKAIETCLSLLDKPVNALEWGSGKSTVYFSSLLPQGSSWLAVEHDPDWFREVKAKIEKHPGSCASVVHIPPDGPFVSGIDDGSFETFRNYVLAPARRGGSYEFILVDGRARVECMAVGWDLLKESGVMVLHDAQRQQYAPGIPKNAFLVEMVNPEEHSGQGAIGTVFMFKQQGPATALKERLESLFVQIAFRQQNTA
jgi:predicted O-methyltransferase YrrM